MDFNWIGFFAVFLWLIGWFLLGLLVIHIVDKANGRK